MTHSEIGAARRLQRLERLLAGRQARLQSSLARQQVRATRSGPLGGLQRYGYLAAGVLALAAVAPAVLGFGWRRRRLLAGAAINGVGIRQLRKRFDRVAGGRG